MTTENTLPAKLEDMSYADIAAFIGQADKQEEFKFPSLSINAAHENDDQKPIPAGTFTFTREGKRWYSEKGGKIKFRIFLRTYQYKHWDDAEKKVVSRSKQIKSFREEAYDTVGTIRCGKVSKKELENLSPLEKEKQEGRSCVQILYGVVSGKFTCPATNEEQTLENYPVVWQTAGNAFFSMGNFIEEVTKRKKLYINIDIEIGLRREKNGAVTYYVPEPTTDWAQPSAWNNERDLPLMAEYVELVNDSNKYVLEKYNEALTNKANDTTSAKVVASVNKKASKGKTIDGDFKPLDADFEDDISDIGTDRDSVLAAG